MVEVQLKEIQSSISLKGTVKESKMLKNQKQTKKNIWKAKGKTD